MTNTTPVAAPKPTDRTARFDPIRELFGGSFGSLWLVRIRGEVWRRRAEAAALRAARA